MSECVVRMKFLKNCYECEMRGAWAFCPIGKFPVVGYKKQRHEDCPVACALPEGHGRLVDADEMYKKSEAFCNQCRQGEHDCEKCNYIVAQGYMYKSPTIVPATEGGKE